METRKSRGLGEPDVRHENRKFEIKKHADGINNRMGTAKSSFQLPC